MNTTEAGLLLVGAAVLCSGALGYFNSRKIYLQEQKMGKLEDAVSKVEANDAAQDAQIALSATQLAEKDAIIQQLRDESTGAMSQADQERLAARLEALLTPSGGGETPAPAGGEGSTGETATSETPSETLSGEVVAKPVTNESGEIIGGELPDETGSETADDIAVDSGPVGEAKPEGSA